MNLRQMQYAIELSKSLSFSQTSAKLKISQPALSKQIHLLEEELGVKLFDRSTLPLSLTSAGEHFISHAQRLLYEEDQLVKSMGDFKSGKKGNIVIGISPFRSLYLIPPLAEKIKEKYPEVKVTLHEAASDILRAEAAEGKYDFAIVNLPVDESVLSATPIEADTLVLAVPNSLLEKLPEGIRSKGEIDFKECSALPFIAVSQTQELRLLFDKMCAAADIEADISMEVNGISTAWAMARRGLGATILPLQFIENFDSDKTLHIYNIKDVEDIRKPAVITRRGQYLSPYAKYAIELLSK